MERKESRKSPRARRSFTAEFKAEIVELCRRGDRSVGAVARDFDLTETAVREWVRQAELDDGTRSDGLTTCDDAPYWVSVAAEAPWWGGVCGDRALERFRHRLVGGSAPRAGTHLW